MAKKQLGAIDRDLVERVDAARGDVPRIAWVERACEMRLQELEAGWAGSVLGDDPVTAAQKAEYLEKSEGGTKPVEFVVEGGSMLPRFRCPAGHGVVENAGPGARCFCNRKVVPV